jgi:hypothetical protein
MGGNPLENVENVLDKHLANLSEGVRGYKQALEKFVIGSQKVLEHFENFFREFLATFENYKFFLEGCLYPTSMCRNCIP